MDKPINVLMVDDELLVRQGLRSTIDWARYGMQVAGEAANGEAALDLYERLQPEVIITDIVMPRMGNGNRAGQGASAGAIRTARSCS